MDITLEWDGILGLVKLLLIFLIPMFVGFIIGKKTKS
tara:strand:- start:688 stop:798 length:111 start_codon:yes stop_codon:yes gene_type:complete